MGREMKSIEGRCPICNEFVTDVSDSGIDDGGYFYDYRCHVCDQTFTQWYDLKFSKTYVDNKEIE